MSMQAPSRRSRSRTRTERRCVTAGDVGRPYRGHPEKVAALIVETGESLTYAQLDERPTRLVNVLAEAALPRS